MKWKNLNEEREPWWLNQKLKRNHFDKHSEYHNVEESWMFVRYVSYSTKQQLMMHPEYKYILSYYFELSKSMTFRMS